MLFAVANEDLFFVEANPDLYGIAPASFEELRNLAGTVGAASNVDWTRVEEVTRRRSDASPLTNG